MFSLFAALTVSISYVCLLDCGKNMELFVFKYDETKPLEAPTRINTKADRIYRTLANAYFDGTIVNYSLDKAFELANNALQAEGLAKEEVKFYVCGTSLMRELDESDLEEIKKQVVDYFEEKKESLEFNYLLNNETFRVLSTVDEAIYTFISVNQKVGTSKNPVPVAGLSGGNSFLVSTKKSTLKTQNHNIKIGTETISVGIADYPLYSTNNLKKNHSKQLARFSGRADVESECYPSGYVSGDEEIISITGKGDFDKCNTTLENCSMKKDKYQYNLFFDSLEQPPLGDYEYVYATGAYYTSFSKIFVFFKNAIPEMQSVTFETIKTSEFAEIGKKFCSMTATELKEVINTEVTDPDEKEDYLKYVLGDCIEFAIQARLLREGYTIPDDKVKRYGDANWQIGFVVTNEIEHEKDYKQLSWVATVIIGVAIFAIIVVVLVILIRKCINKKREDDERSENERLTHVDPSEFDLDEP